MMHWTVVAIRRHSHYSPCSFSSLSWTLSARAPSMLSPRLRRRPHSHSQPLRRASFRSVFCYTSRRSSSTAATARRQCCRIDSRQCRASAPKCRRSRGAGRSAAWQNRLFVAACSWPCWWKVLKPNVHTTPGGECLRHFCSKRVPNTCFTLKIVNSRLHTIL